MGLYHKMVSYGARGPDKAAQKALGPAADYVFAAVWWSPQLPYKQVKEFVKAFEDLHKQKIEWYAYSYNVPLMLFKAIETAGSLEPDKIRQALTKTEIDYAIIAGGRMKFEADGQANYPFVVVQGQPGKDLPVIIWPRDAATGEPVCPVPQK
jgi:branched-chain amino acid transport system substrate-binding protein